MPVSYAQGIKSKP